MVEVVSTHSAGFTYEPLRIRDLPVGERPRERLRERGPDALSDAELLAILMRTGTRNMSVVEQANRLLMDANGLIGLSRASYGELAARKGFGDAKAAQLLAAMELGRRLASSRNGAQPSIESPQDVAAVLTPLMAHLDQEHFRVLSLDSKNRILAKGVVSKGTVNTAQVRAAEVFRDAVRLNAPSVIIAHNHPSGDPSPSVEDINITRDLTTAGHALDIEVLDHVIIARDGYASLKERGLGFDGQPRGVSSVSKRYKLEVD